MKKYYGVFFSVIILFTFVAVNGYAIASTNKSEFEQQFTYEQYLEQVELGYIDENVSYQALVEANKMTFEDLVKSIENNPNFSLIYESSHLDLESEEFRAVVTRLNPGDVFIMNSTASWGLSGHAAMALSNDEIINIAGPSSKTEIVPRSTFNGYYTGRDIELYRTNNYYWGTAAAEWADQEYRTNKADYELSMDAASTRPTYCSKLVFQAYKYGAGLDSIAIDAVSGLISPYALKNLIKIDKHGEYDPTI